jgi:hypothetical protein
LILVLALIVLVCSAHADSISFTTSVFEDGGTGNWDFSFITGDNHQKWYQPTFLGYGDPVDNPSYPLNLTQFNPALGTLNKVTLSLSRTVDASVFCQASNPPTTFRYYLANQASWVMSGATLRDFTFVLTNYPDTTVVNDSNLHTVPKVQIDSLPGNQFTSGLTPFIGIGTFATELYEAAAAGSSFGNGSWGSTLHVTTEVTVNYDYAPVPLPPGVLLLGSGLLGLGLLRGRKLFRA